MLEISDADIRLRIERDNPWWTDPQFEIREAKFQRRIYFAPFKALALNPGVQRAAVLLGPRRVGKTVILRQLIHEAIKAGTNAKSILYASIDAPIYSRFPLEKFIEFLPIKIGNGLVIFDEFNI